MPEPYVIRFISQRSGVGKTQTASRVVKLLKDHGYVVGVVKHCSSGISLEEKDSGKYLESGAEVVVASSPRLAVIYESRYIDLLENAMVFVKAPVVVVEGYRDSDIGEVVLVTGSLEDLELLKKTEKVIAIASRGEIELDSSGVFTYRLGDEEKLVELLEKRIIEHYLSQTPRTNCQQCGFPSCIELVKAYVKGRSQWCPVVSRVNLVIDGAEISLNPFVKNFIRSVVKGMISVLKGIPSVYRKITIEITDNLDNTSRG